MHASSSCSDPFVLENTYMNGAWFQKYLDLKYVHVDQEIGYAQLTKVEHDEILNAGSQGELLESYKLSAQDAKTLRNKLLADSSDSVVPFGAKIVSSLSVYAGNPASFITGSFLKYLLAQDAFVKAKARDIAQVIADGGHVNRLLAIGTNSQSQNFLINTFVYAVDIANEHREYATASCTYAVKVDYSEFETKSTQNNKIIRRVSDKTWNRIDIDTNHVEQVLFETGRDDDFIYLNENDPNNRINDAYRFSLKGGPWQTKMDSGTWGTLCSKVIAR